GLVLLFADGAPVDLDHVLVQVGLAPQLADDLAVDGDVTVLDQRLRLATRGDAGMGEDFLQPFKHPACFRAESGLRRPTSRSRRPGPSRSRAAPARSRSRPSPARLRRGPAPAR